MYYFSGALTIAWGLLLYLILPPDPIRARGFNERERYILVARVRSNNSGVRNTHFKLAHVRELALDIKFWLMVVIALLSMIANGAISTFVPLIIAGFGFSTLNSLLLVMPAGAYAGTMMLILPYLAYKYQGLRSWLFLLGQFGTTLAALLLWNLPSSAKGALLFACYILPSTGAGYAVLMGLQIANTSGYTKRSIASSGLFVGYCLGELRCNHSTSEFPTSSRMLISAPGNIAGPLVFRAVDAPRYVPGFIVVVASAIAAGVLIVVYRFVCVWENKKRDTTGVVEGFDHAYEDDLTDKTVSSPLLYSFLCERDG